MAVMGSPETAAMTAYREHGGALLRKARRILGSEADAFDVVHGLFADLMAKPAARFDPPYLHRAVTNRSLNALRDRKNRASLLSSNGDTLVPPQPAAQDRKVIDLEMLAQLVERLDDRNRELLTALYVDEMTQEEAAQSLGISRRAVAKRLSRVRAMLAAIAAGGVAIALAFAWPRSPTPRSTTPGAASYVKGGTLAIEVVREHNGAPADPGVFVDGDRIGVRFTCAPGQATPRIWAQQGPETVILDTDGAACGNRVPVSHPLRLTGTSEVKVCASDGTAEVCTTVRPAR